MFLELLLVRNIYYKEIEILATQALPLVVNPSYFL